MCIPLLGINSAFQNYANRAVPYVLVQQCQTSEERGAQKKHHVFLPSLLSAYLVVKYVLDTAKIYIDKNKYQYTDHQPYFAICSRPALPNICGAIGAPDMP